MVIYMYVYGGFRGAIETITRKPDSIWMANRNP